MRNTGKTLIGTFHIGGRRKTVWIALWCVMFTIFLCPGWEHMCLVLLLPSLSIVARDLWLRPCADSRPVSTVWTVASGFGTKANTGGRCYSSPYNFSSSGTKESFPVAWIFTFTFSQKEYGLKKTGMLLFLVLYIGLAWVAALQKLQSQRPGGCRSPTLLCLLGASNITVRIYILEKMFFLSGALDAASSSRNSYISDTIATAVAGLCSS